MRAGPNLVGVRAPVRSLHGGRYPLMRYGQRHRRRALRGADVRVDRRGPARRAAAGRHPQRDGAPGAGALGGRDALLGRRAEAQRRAALSLPAARRARSCRASTRSPAGSSTRRREYALRRSRDPARRRSSWRRSPARGRASSSTCSCARAAARSRRRRRSGSPSTASRSARARRRRLDFAVPSQPVADGTPAALELRAAPFTAHRDAMLRAWKATFARAMQLVLPERRVQDAYYASLMHILLPRYQLPDGDWVQPVNKLRYHAFWLRDASVMTQALDLAGCTARRARTSPSSIAGSTPTASSSRARASSTATARRCGRSASTRCAAATASSRATALPSLGARGRLARTRAPRADELGLVPPSDPRDNELVAGHLAGDDFWAVAGLEAAVGVARMLGDDARARDWSGRARRRCARPCASASADAAARNGGAIPPALDRDGRPRLGQPLGRVAGAGARPVVGARHAHAGPRARALPRGARDLRRVSQPAPLPRLPRLADRAAARRAGARRAGPVRLARPHDEHERRLRDRRAAVRAALGRRQPRAARLVRRRARRAAAQHARARVAARGLELLSALPARWLAPGAPDGRARRADEARAGRRVAAAGARRRRADVEGRRARRARRCGGACRRRARGVRAPGLRRGRRRRCCCPAARACCGSRGACRAARSSFDGVAAALQKAYRERGLTPPA